MKIRLANLNDKEALIELALENKIELQNLNIPISSTKIEKTIENLFILNKGSHVVFVAETISGELAGGLLASLECYFYNEALQAQLIQWYVKKRYRGTSIAPRLLKAYVEWAKANNAIELFLGITSDIDSFLSHRMLMKMGFRHVGGNYTINLDKSSLTVINPVSSSNG